MEATRGTVSEPKVTIKDGIEVTYWVVRRENGEVGVHFQIHDVRTGKTTSTGATLQ
jgi:hypothetical protein